MDGAGLTRRAVEALSGVKDPELGLDLVALGLMYGVAPDAEGVRVRMTLTSRGCPMGWVLAELARGAVSDACGRPARLEMVWDPPWDPAMISEAGRCALRGGVRS